MASAMRPHRVVVRNVRDMTYAYKSSLYIDVDVVRCLVIPRLVYRISKYLEHRATFTARYPVALALKRLDPLGTKFVSRFSPGVVVKFGFDHDAEVRALQFIHGQLSVHTPRVLHHAPFPKLPVVEPWHWEDVQAFLSIPLSATCLPPNSTTSPINCSLFLMRCAHTRARRSGQSPAVLTAIETCPTLGNLRTHFRTSTSK